MVGVSEAFEIARSGNKQVAITLLKQEFQRLQSSDQKVELCDWIASCFQNLHDYSEAAQWYETAGDLALSEIGSPLINALSALKEYEKALGCHEMGDDEEALERCLETIEELNRVYAAA
jgi:tetratricopeptide (TPR) repeat protein